MKKMFLLSILITIVSINGKSQISKKNWLVGGAASFRSSKYDNTGGVSSKQLIVELSGDVGYFILDKFAIGLKPGYTRNESFNPNKTVNTYAIGPFIRYYFLPKEKYVNIFSELSYQYGLSKASDNVSQNSNNVSLLGGCAVFFNSSVALEFAIGYSAFSYNSNSGKVKSVIAGIGFHFHLEK